MEEGLCLDVSSKACYQLRVWRVCHMAWRHKLVPIAVRNDGRIKPAEQTVMSKFCHRLSAILNSLLNFSESFIRVSDDHVWVVLDRWTVHHQKYFLVTFFFFFCHTPFEFSLKTCQYWFLFTLWLLWPHKWKLFLCNVSTYWFITNGHFSPLSQPSTLKSLFLYCQKTVTQHFFGQPHEVTHSFQGLCSH